MRKPAALTSLAIHGVAVLLLLLATFHTPVMDHLPKVATWVDRLRAPMLKLKDSGGGGGRSLTRATKGDPPPKAAHRPWIPPTAVVLNEHPKLILEQALLDSDSNVRPMVVGDPFSRLAGQSGGTGLSGIGIGDRDGKGGIGDGDGSRVGGPDSDRSRVRLTRGPQVLYKEEPEYSEEARKARWQGTVVLEIDIDISGRATNIRVAQGPGMGLNEKAVAAVQKWRFRPAYSGDRAVVAPATVYVTFHLL